MASVIQQSGLSSVISYGDNSTQFTALGGTLVNHTIEARSQATFNTAGGTFSNGGVYVVANDVTLASTVRLRVNAVNANPNISITASTTGLFTDFTNTSTISATDKVCWSVVIPSVAGAHAVDISTIFCQFASATNTYQKFISGSRNSPTYGDTAVNYCNLGDEFNFGTTEATVQNKFRSVGTISNGLCFLATNTRTTDMTIKSRINGVDGTIAVTITASTTGLFQDTTHSDTIAVGDLVNMSIQGVAGSGSGVFTLLGMEYSTTTGKSELFANSNVARTYNASTTYFFPTTGSALTSALGTTEAQLQCKAGFASTVSNLKINVTANLAATDDTFDFRINGVSSALTVPVTALTTGLFEDTTHTASVIINDLINYRLVVGITAGTTVSDFGCLVDSSTPVTITMAMWWQQPNQPLNESYEMIGY